MDDNIVAGLYKQIIDTNLLLITEIKRVNDTISQIHATMERQYSTHEIKLASHSDSIEAIKSHLISLLKFKEDTENIILTHSIQSETRRSIAKGLWVVFGGVITYCITVAWQWAISKFHL